MQKIGREILLFSPIIYYLKSATFGIITQIKKLGRLSFWGLLVLMTYDLACNSVAN